MSNLSILSSNDSFGNDSDDLIFSESDQPKEIEKKEEPKPVEVPKKKTKKEWTPDPELIKDMPELNVQPVTYSKEEYKVTNDTELKNITDEMTKKDAAIYMENIQLQDLRLRKIKEKYGIKHLNIPEYSPDGKSEDVEGKMLRFRILSVASDPDETKAMAKLDEVFQDIINNYPGYITEWIKKPEQQALPSDEELVEDGEEPEPEVIKPNYEVKKEQTEEKTEEEKPGIGFVSEVIINKENISQFGWTPEDYDKISKSKTINLKITEGADIEFNTIEDEDDHNVIENVLKEYRRKLKDVTVVLPASCYRATMRGLSYTEVLDLSYQEELNQADLYSKGWSMIYDHMENMSIEPKEHSFYLDPVTRKKIEVTEGMTVPEGVEVTKVSRYEDFLMKTSHTDYQFLLWKLLCATILDNEIITLTCGTMINGKKCNSRFDWLYTPEDLIDSKDMDQSVLEAMKKTGEVQGREAIDENYHNSLVYKDQSVELPSSKIKVVFGHASVYDYMNRVIPAMPDFDSIKTKEDEFEAGLALQFSGFFSMIKYILIPKENGKFMRVHSLKSIMAILKQLNDVDITVLATLQKMIEKPYFFTFSIKDVTCPQCKHKMNIPITNVIDLIFLVTQVLVKTEVNLKI